MTGRDVVDDIEVVLGVPAALVQRLAVLTTEAADLRRALAQAEHERDEALAEATRLADILTNCGYWG